MRKSQPEERFAATLLRAARVHPSDQPRTRLDEIADATAELTDRWQRGPVETRLLAQTLAEQALPMFTRAVPADAGRAADVRCLALALAAAAARTNDADWWTLVTVATGAMELQQRAAGHAPELIVLARSDLNADA